MTFDPWVAEAHSRTFAKGRAKLNRFLAYRDLDPAVPGREVYTLAEAGTAFYDPNLGVVRQFCNRSTDPDFLSDDLPAMGGYLFEALDPDPASADYAVIGGDAIPIVLGTWAGTSLARSESLPNPQGNPRPHLITGTAGGHVYAVEIPDDQDTRQIVGPLSYRSPDLGWYAIGLDVGDLDSDGVDEVVAGVLVDTGTFDDWANGDLLRNRAHLYVLEINQATEMLDVAHEVNADFAGPGCGIGAGVFGVKIDDVNADGQPEIWCGDAAGHLYLFEWDPGTQAWITFYRTSDLGTHPGMFKNLFPMKDSAGRTVKLVVVSPGYVRAFDVDWTQL